MTRWQRFKKYVGELLCSLERHKWNTPKHRATRNCLRCIRTEAVDARTGRWVQV